MNIFFIHWNEAEMKEKIIPLRKAGHTVRSHSSVDTVADLRTVLPGVLVICLDRLPSHGKAYAEWFWEAKKRQQIPIVFCGGKPEKIMPIREKFPTAVYCSNEALPAALADLK